MKTRTFATLLALCFLAFPCQAQKYESSWESVTKHKDPEWFKDAKFGIYFHWGPYSVPAYKTEWYSHYMYVKGHDINKHHVEKYGPLNKFGYKDFIPMFKAEKFDADKWAALFKKAGARFAGPVAEHADGFAMWDSALTEWDAMDRGPKKDIVGAMEKAVRKQGMKFIATLHHQWLFAWYPTWDPNTDASFPEYRDIYGPPAYPRSFEMARGNPDYRPDIEFNQRWLSRSIEVVDKYKPDLVWFDIKLNILSDKTLTDFLSHYYNSAEKWGRPVVATYKSKDFKKGAGILDLERSRMKERQDFPWLTDDSIDWKAWCDVEDPKYKTTNRLIDFLVDVVSKNGCVLLNITPRANGEIPQPVQDRLLEMGAWLELNGEAIYKTRPWNIYGEGPMEIIEGHLSEEKNPEAVAEDIRFTTRDGILYAIALDWPEGGKLKIRSLGTEEKGLGAIASITMPGNKSALKWSRDATGLTIELPKTKPCEHAFVFAIRSK